MKSRKTLDLTSGPVTGKLLRFVYPILVTNLLQYCYNAALKVGNQLLGQTLIDYMN